MSKIREAMRKAEQSYRTATVGSEVPPSPGADGPLGLVPALPSEMLVYYEAIGKQIDVALGGSKDRTLVFTAAVGSEGVSTVVSQYAEMLSRRGEKILVVDGNPRNPSLHRYFQVPEAPGLAEYVAGTVSHDAVVHATGFANLSLVPLGRCSNRSQAERITDELGSFMEKVRSPDEYVLVDADHVGSPFHSRSAVSGAAGVVLVLRAGRTNREVARRACHTVARMGGRMLGSVLNRRSFPIPDFIYRRL